MCENRKNAKFDPGNAVFWVTIGFEYDCKWIRYPKKYRETIGHQTCAIKFEF